MSQRPGRWRAYLAGQRQRGDLGPERGHVVGPADAQHHLALAVVQQPA